MNKIVLIGAGSQNFGLGIIGDIFMDEIHHDLTYPDKPHTTFLKAAPEAEEISLIFTAATKTFNIAGCHTGTTIIPNPKIRSVFDLEHAAFGKTPNRFGMIMTEAAYREGAEWLDQLMLYLANNKNIFIKRLPTTPPKNIKIYFPFLQHIQYEKFFKIFNNFLYIKVSAVIIIPSLVLTVPFLIPLITSPFCKISISVMSKLNCSALLTLKKNSLLTIKNIKKRSKS